MNDNPKLFSEIINIEVESICQRYKVEPEIVRTIVEQNFAKQPKIHQKILERLNTEDITRFKDYQQIIKASKKQVYYLLRQYHQEPAKEIQLITQLKQLITDSSSWEQMDKIITELLLTHVSTRERFKYCTDFYTNLFNLLKPPKNLIDIGCGLQPMAYPFTMEKINYVAIDKDCKVIECLKIFSSYVQPNCLTPICIDIAQGNWKTNLGTETDTFDVALMLKLIPVVYRQNRALLAKLAKIPAHHILITASTEAMTRNQNIRRREDKFLRKFIALTERNVVSDFCIENEFGYLLAPIDA